MDSNGLVDSLLALARNHRWTWNVDANALFGRLPGFDTTRHPVSIVSDLGDAELRELAADGGFMSDVEDQLAELATITEQFPNQPDIAYFSPEFGISDLVPQYSGGLGILAGDHLKAASDLGTSLCGVGLFYRGGFFRQSMTGGSQTERYETYKPGDFGCIDTEIEVAVPFGDRDVIVHVWRLDVGRTALILLDTDVAANNASDRAITDRLYSGDRRHRLEQELVLGVGGARAIDALGWDTPVIHLNEGHAGFLILELLDRQIQNGSSLADALVAIQPGVIFTTHTPVPAGIDRFTLELSGEYLTPWARRWGIPVADLLALGTDASDEPAAFNMAAFCLRAAGRANGVSALHGAVSRELFVNVPGGDAIGHVTNGVHARTWVMPRLQSVFDDRLGDGWDRGDPSAWQRVDRIADENIVSVRRAGAEDLAAVVDERTGVTLDPNALIIGFARRFATYKRATLLLRHVDTLGALLADDERPVQFVFAGKAHPADNDGKALLAEIVEFGASAEANGRFLFIPDYDIGVARAMYAGCDVWLNTPVRPHEASGTSGEKSALNGGINCSISDGWWDEMADGINGWTIPVSEARTDSQRDIEESAATLDLIEREIVAEYHADGRPWSAPWLQRIRHSWATLGPRVTAARMVSDYASQLYQPALDDRRAS